MNRNMLLGLLLLFFMIVAGSVDDDGTPPDYTVSCISPESSDDCSIINRDGISVSSISYQEATEEDLFNKPSNIQVWLDMQR